LSILVLLLGMLAGMTASSALATFSGRDLLHRRRPRPSRPRLAWGERLEQAVAEEGLRILLLDESAVQELEHTAWRCSSGSLWLILWFGATRVDLDGTRTTEELGPM
jgi:hypothetical protein